MLPENPKVRLFVYGSLRPGKSGASLLGTFQIIQKNVPLEGYKLCSWEGYPVLIPEKESTVWGVLVEVEADRLPELDEYEETELGYYTRHWLEAWNCFVYLAGPNLPNELPRWQEKSYRYP